MIIDFDSKFRTFIGNWMITNEDKYSSSEEMEVEALDIYAEWLNAPADWLDGVCPADYFSKYESADELVEMLVEYLNTDIGVPDLLLDAISAFAADSKESLTKLFHLEYPVKENSANEARMISINLLEEIDDTFLFDEYIKLLVDESTSEETATLIIERFEFAGKEVAEKLINHMQTVDVELIAMRCMDVLVNFPGDDRIYKVLIKMFNEYSDTSLLAAYLGKYGDERAITILKEALNWEDINYLDYMEIRNAIEELGEEIEHKREFAGDVYYESLKNIEQ